MDEVGVVFIDRRRSLCLRVCMYALVFPIYLILSINQPCN